MKQCTKCKLFKEKNEFFKDKQKSSGFRPDCKNCNMKRSLIWNKNNLEKRKNIALKFDTGLTRKQYSEMLEYQKECCAICGKHFSENLKNLSVDHCHKSNIIRGLLCFKCNIGLGYFCDNEDILNKAINYLNNNQSFKNLKWKQKN